MAQARNTKPTPRAAQRPAPRAAQRPAPRAAQPAQRPTNGQQRTTTEANRFSVEGDIHFIGEAIQVSDRFTKREFVLNVTDNPQYPQFVAFQASGNGVNWLDDYSDGDAVIVHFNLRGREWTNPEGEVKFFTTLAAWKIESAARREPVAEDDVPF